MKRGRKATRCEHGVLGSREKPCRLCRAARCRGYRAPYMRRWREAAARKHLAWESLWRRGLTLRQIEEVRQADIQRGRRLAGLAKYPGGPFGALYGMETR